MANWQQIAVTEDFIIEYDTDRAMYRVSYFQDNHFVDDVIFDSYDNSVIHGKWISASNKPGTNIGMKCSICGARIKYSEFYNGNHHFCYKCGAKMDGGSK